MSYRPGPAGTRGAQGEVNLGGPMLLETLIARPVIARRSSILADSILASSLDEAVLDLLESMGEVVSVPSGAVLFEEGSPSDHLHVVLDGALVPATKDGAPPFWVGPGDLCGEGGFVAGTPRRRTMMAFGPDAR